jgi:predicted ATPase
LLKSRRQALHRRAAEVLHAAEAEPERIAHHWTEAGLDDLAIESWGRAGDEALRHSAFQEAIAHLSKAIAMADKQARAGSQRPASDTAETQEVKAEAERRQRRLRLQTAYGQAMIWSKGFVAEETRAAIARAAELVQPSDADLERYQVHYAQWARSFIRGELFAARKLAESFVHEAEADGRGMEAAVAHRTLGQTCLLQGEVSLASNHIQRALALHVPERDMDARRIFGSDTGIVATAYLALLTWQLGEIESARRLIEQVIRDARSSDHATTIVQAHIYATVLEGLRDDPAATARAAEALVEFARKRDLEFYLAFGGILSSWARGRLDDPVAGARELREALAAYLKQGNGLLAPWFHAMLAELEVVTGRFDDALTSVEAGLALASEAGERWTDPVLFRRKGDILLQRDPANPEPVEDALQTAVAIAREQGARSFGLQTALALAKLYKSRGRPAEAHGALAPALGGFSPTSEMPEIAEAQALLEQLEE